MKFKYKAKKGDRILEGELEAKSRFEVYNFIKSQNAQLISVKNTEPGIFSLQYWNSRISTVPKREVILFADNMSTMLSAGLSLTRALEVARKQTNNPRFKRVISSVLSQVEKGENFNEALKKHKKVFSDLFVSMVASGEIAGNLPQSLKAISLQLERIDSLKRKIKGAMIYPSVIVFAVFGVGVFMMVSVVPTLSSTFKEMNVELPVATKIIISISEFLRVNSAIALVSLLIFISAFVYFVRTTKGKWFMSKVFLTVPIIKNITKELNAARVARTMSSLLQSGVDVVESLHISADVVQNMYFKDVLIKMADSVQKGKTISQSLEANKSLFPTMFVELLAVGEETGALKDMMQKVADYFEEEVNEKTKNMSTIVEPFLMLFIGISVGFFAYAMVVPMYSLADAI